MKRTLAILLAAILFTEVVSSFTVQALDLQDGDTYAEDYHNFSRFEAQGFWKSIGHKLSPYFGPVGKDGLGGQVNNYGFVSKTPYPYHRKPDDFVIGIFGGSFANKFAMDAIQLGFFDSLPAHNPALAGKHIVVINLAINGSKQPQQFNVAAYFLPTLDLVLNIDGFQEVSGGGGSRYPLEFPPGYHLSYGAGRPNFWENWIGEVASNAPAIMGEAAVAIPPLMHSATYFLLWKASIRAERVTLAWLQNHLSARREKGRPFPPEVNPHNTKTPPIKAGADLWERYTRMEFEIARVEHKKAVFVLQPNLMASEKRVLTPAEVAIKKSVTRQDIFGGYEELRRRAQGLRKIGVPVVDATDVFDQLTETVYDDDAHAKPIGYRILAQRISDALTELGPAFLPDALLTKNRKRRAKGS